MNDTTLERVKTKQVQLVIEGRVQGVGFRAWVSSNARKMGLVGFVRNRTDGTVEAHFAGKEEIVDKMIAKCWDGPMASRVTNVTVRPSQQELSDSFMSAATL